MIRRLVLVVIGIILGSAGLIAAQEPVAVPAYVTLNGDLVRWAPGDAVIVPESTCDLTGLKVLNLELSPTGTHLALHVVPAEIFAEGYAPSPTGNLWICDLASGDMRALTDINVLQLSLSRDAIWSPDGAQIAWGRINDDGMTAAIDVHDLASASTRTLIASTPLDYGCGVGPFPPDFVWSADGIAVGYFFSSTNDPCTSTSTGLYVYTADGTLRADLAVGPSGSMDGITNRFWDGSAPGRLIFSASAPSAWETVTLDGERDAGGALQAYLPGADADGATITWVSGAAEGQLTRIALPNLPSLTVTTGPGIALSPDGTTILMALRDSLFVLENGTFRTLLTLDAPHRGFNLTWAQRQYRLVSTDTAAEDCPSVPVVSYSGLPVRVIPGLGANNLRSAPLASADVIGTIESGGTAELLERASVCSGGVRWRFVAAGDQVGWTAESQGSTTYLEPAQS